MSQKTLHITNGDSTSNTMIEAGLSGTVIPWRDILHDGPVPAGLSLHALAKIRAEFLAQPGVASYTGVLERFRQRDRVLESFAQFQQVIIWLEHDLYDQLQLLQLLAWFADQDTQQIKIKLICIDDFPGIDPFYGLGQLDTQQILSLQGSEQPVTQQQLDLAKQGWLAFTSETPIALVDFLDEGLSVFPFLKAALFRHLEEYPDSQTGLSRHERQILEMVVSGIQKPEQLFVAHQKLEQAPYLGDWGYWSLIERLTNTKSALLKTETGNPFLRPPDIPAGEAFRSQILSLTDIGRKMLQGELDWMKINPSNRWMGGVHLNAEKTIWRWDANNQAISR